MTPERWRQVTRIYGAVMTKPPAARPTALLELCPDDEALRKEVESLLADDSGAAVLDQSLGEVASSLADQNLSGRSLGPYRLESSIGAGGMGQVYRANDIRLHRTVAIKVLAPSLANDSQFRARFDREAKAVAALNHPHICTLHDIGSSDGIDYLVMEYVEGETLSARLERGALPFDQALTTAIQIAEALAAAHRQGIVHRDLKPGNVMLTKSGVKLLDFGLAKPSQPATMAGPMSMLPTTPPMGPTRGAPLTVQGTILGTLQYMAPEQLEGKEADTRTDIFAFGAIVYEMVTGKKAFTGGSQASLIGAIMHAEPQPMATEQPLTPVTLDRVVKTCLAKDPDARWQSAIDLARELRWCSNAASPSEVKKAGRSTRMIVAVAVASALIGAGIVAAIANFAKRPTAGNASIVRFTIPPPEATRFAANPGGGGSVPMAVSPDGKAIVFSVGTALVVRRLDSLESRSLPDTANSRYPFWSPDSRFVAFFTLTELKKVDLAGGSAQKICDATSASGGSWAPDDTILFSSPDGLATVSARGGSPRALPLPAALRRPRIPSFLPDGRHFLVIEPDPTDAAGTVYASSLDNRDARKVLDSVRGATYAAGHLLFVRGETLFGQPFDASTLDVSGTPTPFVQGVGSNLGSASFAVSSNGVLAYANSMLVPSQLQWVDRTGRVLEKVDEPHQYTTMNLSFDERRVVVTRRDRATADAMIWTVDVDRGAELLLTQGGNAIFSPDGMAIAATDSLTTRQVQRLSVKGEVPPQTLLPKIGWPTDWSADGRWVLVQRLETTTQFDISAIDVEHGNAVRAVVQTGGNDWQGHLSRDQRWLAYTSDVTGRPEVYIRPFMRDGETVKVSGAGGAQPRWRSDGRELYYVSDDGVNAVSLKVSGENLTAETPTRLFAKRFPLPLGFFGNSYLPAAQGTRFLVAETVGDERLGEIAVVVNWPALLAGVPKGDQR
jgi:serine/threonine protein kinase/Tol biopolymer transport system component